MPLIVGDAALAMRVCEAAIERGVFAQAIRPPTVPEGTSRLRLALMASHTKAELRDAARALGRAALHAGFRPGRRRPAGRAPQDRHRPPFDRSPRSVRGVFVTGTDTGVGKTVVAASIVTTLRARGEPVRAFKPVVTGTDEPDPVWPADHELLARAAGMDPREVTPVTFAPAVSPHLAAELAGTRIEPAELVAHARALGAPLVAEGVGGLLVPLTTGYSVRDLAVDLGLPVVIAARPGLGTINHTLLTLEAARAAGLEVRCSS